MRSMATKDIRGPDVGLRDGTASIGIAMLAVRLTGSHRMFNRSKDLSRSYRQTGAGECGLACLGYVLAKFGNHVDLRDLRRQFPVSGTGARLSDLVEIARAVRLEGRGVVVGADEVAALRLPCILHWNDDHFVVLTKRRLRSVVIHDPARGERVLAWPEFDRFFSGVALELSPMIGFESRPMRERLHWRQVTGRTEGLKRGVGQILVVAACLQLFALSGPLLSQWVIDDAIASSDSDLVWVICAGLTLSLVLKTSLDVTRAWLSLVLTTQLMTAWCSRIMSHLMRLPVRWFDLRHVGDVVSRFQSTQAIQQAVSGKVTEIVIDLIFCLGLLAVMLVYSPALTSVALFSVCGYCIVRVLPHGPYHRSIEEAVIKEAKAQSFFIESIRSMPTVKVGCLESHRSGRWANIAVDAVNYRFAAQKMMLMFGGVYAMIFGLQSAIILGIGAHQAAAGAMSIGMLVAFTSYKDDFCSRVQRLVDNVLAIRGLRVHIDRLGEIVTEPEEEIGAPGSFCAAKRSASPHIDIAEISHRHSEGMPWVLSKFSLHVAPGEHVALVGPSGAGKSTLVKILMGLTQPSVGEVRQDGQPITRALAQWRRDVSVVMQDDNLLSGTVLENITFFANDVVMDDALAAARMADILGEVEAMPMQFSTEVGDLGSWLSGGQRQRLLLARALYRKPRVLVLDEATSHLDIASERRVNESIASLGISRITIAHRPETISIADRVVRLG